MKKILIAGTNSGVGKTTISLGIMQALTKRNLKVQPYKVGPDYIDPSYHTFITGRYSRNLDSYMLEDEKIKYIVKNSSKDADISVVEGVMGLYDGYGIDLDDCTSSYTSKLLKMPVILVINAKAMATSAAAMVLGYKMLDKNVNIAGGITNNVKSESHYNTLKEAIEKYTGVEVLGYFPPNKEFSLESRHLGLIPSVEMDSLKVKFDNLADEIEKYIRDNNISNVHLKGFNKNISANRQKYDMALTCSKMEALGRVTIEGMYYRNLVVGANSGATVELIEDGKTGYLYKSGEFEDLAKTIEKVIVNNNNNNIINNAHEWSINKFSNNIAPRIIKFMEENRGV